MSTLYSKGWQLPLKKCLAEACRQNAFVINFRDGRCSFGRCGTGDVGLTYSLGAFDVYISACKLLFASFQLMEILTLLPNVHAKK